MSGFQTDVKFNKRDLPKKVRPEDVGEHLSALVSHMNDMSAKLNNFVDDVRKASFGTETTVVTSSGIGGGSGGGGGGGGGTTHNWLSATHPDTIVDSPVLGDMVYGNADPKWQKFAGNTTAVKQFLTQTGTGVISAAPTWATIVDADIPGTIVRTSRVLTVNGTAQDLSADRTWTITTSGTANRITVANGSTNPTVDIAATYVGQTSITTLGTITTGVWNGTKVGLAFGGTNADLSATGGAAQYLKQSSAGAAITVGTIPASDIVSGAALTKVDDTNVTLTLGGSPTTALLVATSLTLGWSGQLSIARGGTGQATALAAFNALSPLTTLGDVLYHNGTNNVRLGANGSSTNMFLRSVSSGNPSWAQPAMTDLSDTAISSPVLDQVLRYNGTAWANANQTQVNAGPGISFYYDDTASDIGGYDTLGRSPENTTEQDISATANSGRTLIQAWATASAGLGSTSIEAGEWIFDIYAYVNVISAGTSSIDIDVYKRTSGGTETLLFNVNSGGVSGTLDLYTVSSIQQAFSINPTDRLVVKVYAKTTAVLNRTVHFTYGGTTHYSNFWTPLVIRHNDLPGLQGGTANEYYHLTSAEYTGTGSGVFVRTTAPTIVTPTIAKIANLTSNGYVKTSGGDGTLGISATVPASDISSAANLTLGTSLQFTSGTGVGVLLVAATVNTIQGIRTVDSPAFTGLTLSGLNTTGAIWFSNSSGTATIDGSNLFWDSTGKNLGVGTASPGLSTFAGQTVVTIRGSTDRGCLEFATGHADGTSVSLGIIQAYDVNSVAADKRIAAITFGLIGTTANNRGSGTSFFAKQDGISGLSAICGIHSIGFSIGTTGIGNVTPLSSLEANGIIQYNRTIAADQTIDAGYGSSIPSDYELATGIVLELLSGGVFEIL